MPSTVVGGGNEMAIEGLMRSSSFFVQCKLYMMNLGRCAAYLETDRPAKADSNSSDVGACNVTSGTASEEQTAAA